MTIFVSIAAYRDPELIPTIEDCLRRARWPGQLRFGICWQHAGDEPPPPALDGGRMRVRDVPWRESQGACWARAECMRLYGGEDWFLQLDSHHRFAQDWDAVLLDQAEKSGSARPVLTTYAAPYDPLVPPPETEAPTCMRFDRFTPEGIALYQFGAIPAWQERKAPMRARFVSGHLLFAPGRFVEDVPYDPGLYFIGEEITLAIRAFTNGYDLFHPAAHVAWHEYTRKNRPKHWDDHVPAMGAEMPWHSRDAASLAKVRRFLSTPEVGRFGCGEMRTFADYEAYAGLSFRRRYASRAARRGDEPLLPVPAAGPSRNWAVRVALDHAALAPAALDNPLFWYVGFHDADGVEIARDDAGRAELQRLLAGGERPILIERRFASPRPPASWTVWPTDRGGRWLGKIERPIDPDSLTRTE
ncbi:MAG: GlcNAc-transferase family protein [Pseudomonadota bacterium]